MLFIAIAISLILLLYRSVVAPHAILSLRLVTHPVALVLYYGLSLPLVVLACFKVPVKGKAFFIWFTVVSILIANTLGMPAHLTPRLFMGSLIVVGIFSAAYISSIKNITIKALLICILVLFGLVGPMSAALVNRFSNKMELVGIEEVRAGEWIR